MPGSERQGAPSGQAEKAIEAGAGEALLAAEAPGLLAALSPLGRRVRQPASFMPLQSAEARGKRLNATIGQITDGAGHALPLPAMAAALAELGEAGRSQALLYSPVEGLPELRRRWRERQRRGRPEHLASSLPMVTLGITQARALVADLFVAPGRAVLLASPVRPPDFDLFAVRHQAEVVAVGPGAWRSALGKLKPGEPALVVLDLTVPPGADEAADAASAVIEAAAGRPLIALVGGPPERSDASLFWVLAGRHANLVPVLAEGVPLTPEPVLASAASTGIDPPPAVLGGLGFLTFPYPAESGVTRLLEEKVKMLLRAAVGSPPALLQTLLLAAL